VTKARKAGADGQSVSNQHPYFGRAAAQRSGINRSEVIQIFSEKLPHSLYGVGVRKRGGDINAPSLWRQFLVRFF
jgi:hypothetical protein